MSPFFKVPFKILLNSPALVTAASWVSTFSTPPKVLKSYAVPLTNDVAWETAIRITTVVVNKSVRFIIDVFVFGIFKWYRRFVRFKSALYIFVSIKGYINAGAVTSKATKGAAGVAGRRHLPYTRRKKKKILKKLMMHTGNNMVAAFILFTKLLY